LPVGIISIASVEAEVGSRGYYNDVFITGNSLINDVAGDGIPNGVNIERVNDLFIKENKIKNCSIDVSGMSSFSIIVSGVNNCQIEENTIEECGEAIYIRYNTVGAIDFNSGCSILRNSISCTQYGVYGSTKGWEAIKVWHMEGKIFVCDNLITSSLVNRSALIFLLDCIGENNISGNVLKTLDSIVIDQVILHSTQTTGRNNHIVTINGNIISSIGEIDASGIYVAISATNSPVNNISILNNMISAPLKREGILIYQTGSDILSPVSNVKIDNNIIENTITTEPITSYGMITATALNTSSNVFYNIGIDGNIISGVGSAIYVKRAWGLQVNNNQCCTNRNLSLTLGVDNGIYCRCCNFVHLSNNSILDYFYPISCQDSMNVTGKRGAFGIVDNFISNTNANFRYGVCLYDDIIDSEISIIGNIVQRNIEDVGFTMSYKLIYCVLEDYDNVILINNNSLHSVDKLDAAISVNDAGTGDYRNLTIVGNRITLSYDALHGIYVNSTTMRNTTVNDNSIIGWFTGNGIYLYANDAFGVIVDGNCFYNMTTSAVNPLSSMISLNIGDDAEEIFISNNSLKNTSTENCGVGKGIDISVAAVSGSSIVGCNVCNNEIRQFYSSMGIGISVVGKFTIFVISNNNISSSTFGTYFYFYDSCGIGTFSNNNIYTYSSSLLIAGSGDYSCRSTNIIGNVFCVVPTGSAGSRVLDFTVVYLDCGGGSDVGRDMMVSNNIFDSRHDVADATGMLLAIESINYGCFVIGNMFRASDTFISGSFPIYIAVTSDSYKAICAFNNLRDVIVDSSSYVLPKIWVGTSGGTVVGTDIWNFGENYVVSLPVSSFVIPLVVDSGFSKSSWGGQVTKTYPLPLGTIAMPIFNTISADYNSDASILYSSFGASIVPYGAEINLIYLSYLYTAGSDSNVFVTWYKRDNVTDTIEEVVSKVALSSAVVYKNLIPASEVIMQYPSEHFIFIEPSGAGSYAFGLNGAQIWYTL
jgi:hypothetical protein